jgi:hypothetical protein
MTATGREFKWGGEVLSYHADAQPDVLRDVLARPTDTDCPEGIEALKRTVTGLLDEGHERFLKACKRTEDPVTFWDLSDLASWLITQTSTNREARRISRKNDE